MIKVRFRNVREIRMGSPFNICEIGFNREWSPDLPKTDWQDLCVKREDGSAVALVRWDTPGNQPGFRIYVLEASSRSMAISDRFLGCCEELWWEGPHRVAWKAFPNLKGAFDFKPTAS